MLNTKVGPALDGWRLKSSLSCRDDRGSHAISPAPNDPRSGIDIVNIQPMIKDFPTHKNIFYWIVKVPVDCFAIDKAVGGIGKNYKSQFTSSAAKLRAYNLKVENFFSPLHAKHQ